MMIELLWGGSISAADGFSSPPVDDRLLEMAAALAREACARVGLRCDDLQPMRLHSSGVFRLPRQHVVVRVSGGADAAGRAGRAVAVTRWLAGLGYPTVVPVAELTQPVVLTDSDGAASAVTFWHEIDIEPGPVSPGDLGILLRRLHDLSRPSLELPMFRPLDRLVEVTQSSPSLGESDRRWLTGRVAELQLALATATFGLGPSGLVHGDGQLGNVIRAAGGSVVLADWDGVAIAPREWDLVPMALEERFGGSPELVGELVTAYDADPIRAEGWAVLCDIYELRSVAAHIRRAPVSVPHAVEAARRIASLRSGDRGVRWYPVG